jgi:hypothetical protein
MRGRDRVAFRARDEHSGRDVEHVARVAVRREVEDRAIELVRRGGTRRPRLRHRIDGASRRELGDLCLRRLGGGLLDGRRRRRLVRRIDVRARVVGVVGFFALAVLVVRAGEIEVRDG